MEESLIDNETIKPVSIRFIDTKRFSPVVHGGDLPSNARTLLASFFS